MAANREQELLKNTIVLSVGKILPKFTSLITLPILTARLSKAEYGTYDLISTLVMLVIPIATLQIQSAAFRFLIDTRCDKKQSSKIITNIFVVTIPIMLLASFVIQFFFGEYSIDSRIFISLYFVFDTLNLTLGQIVRGIGKNKEYSIDATVVSIINMVLIVMLVSLADEGLLGIMISLTVANFGGTVYLVWSGKIFDYIDPLLISKRTIKEMLAYSWPMVPNNLSTWILSLSDRLIITAFLGIEVNAVYAVANKIPNLLSMMQSVMVAAWHENASIAVNDKDAREYYSKMLDTVFSLMFGITCLLIAVTPILFKVFIRGDYYEAYDLMPALILAMFFYVMSSFFGGLYIAHKKTRNVGISTMVAAGVNLSIDLVFVNIIGIWAGAMSTLVAYAMLYFYRLINSKKFQSLQVNYKKQGIQIILMVIMLMLCFLQNTTTNILNIMLGFVLCVVFNKQILKIMICKMIEKIKVLSHT